MQVDLAHMLAARDQELRTLSAEVIPDSHLFMLHFSKWSSLMTVLILTLHELLGAYSWYPLKMECIMCMLLLLNFCLRVVKGTMFQFSFLQDDKPFIFFMHGDVLLCLNEFINSIQGKKG